MSTTLDHQASLDKLIVFFETISLKTCQNLSGIYTEDAYFKDPFNELRGLPAINHVFQHMFVQVREPRFRVTSSVLQNDTAFLVWEFLFTMKNFNAAPQCIRGATHIRFAADGRVNFHRDYWDAAEELYEKLPLLGSLMRFLKRQARK
ncbi:nuclear transport factor 2 family protein [Undibacterium umbellatum]|jgi:steroid delta-isomerase|uniref:Nuclear transport factor 2 family protein n=1 Tax=Undibacterium umbellatum TaxID=2762300 RepID=A0ABR6ZCJ6_9BURK|nr:nuclear transport factor 2 family protein [Undibacterium umbellatum]MBC3909428.1 nuclear transport factor 2 family protein [Undibacterium umbellatum]